MRKCLETGRQQNPLLAKKRYQQGAPNDLEYGRGVTEYGKCLETGKQQNPLNSAKTLPTGSTNDPLDV